MKSLTKLFARPSIPTAVLLGWPSCNWVLSRGLAS